MFSSWAGCLLRGRVSVTGSDVCYGAGCLLRMSGICYVCRVFVTWVGYLLRGSGVCYVGRVFVTWVGYLLHGSDVCYIGRMSVT